MSTDKIRSAGAKLANIAYNLVQRGDLPAHIIASLDAGRKEWDAAVQAPSAPVAPDERAAFETEISKLSDRVDFERYTEQKAARNNHSFPAPQFKPVEIGDYVLSSVQSGWLMWQARAALSVKAEQRAAVHRRVLQNSVDGPDVVGPTVCDLPPSGWYCTRAPGHDGPCAAYPAEAPTPPTTGEA